MTQKASRNTLFLSCLIFFSLGLITAVLGPILPDLAEQTGSSLAAIGSLFTALFLGALLAQLAAGPVSDRIGQRPVLLGGIVLLTAGTVGLALSPSLPIALAFTFLSGLGHGAIDLGTNVMIAEVFAGKSVSALNLLNVFFGIGAVAGPALVSQVWQWWGTSIPALWIIALLVVIPLPFLFRMVVPVRAGTAKSTEKPASWIYRSGLLWTLGFVFLLYVGTESGIGGWATTYMEETTPIGFSQAAFVTSSFWLALTGGRILATVLGNRLSSFTLLIGCLVGALLGTLILNLGQGSAGLTTAGILITGMCFGPIYPTGMAITTALFRSGPGKAASISAAMGSIGGMSLPWLEGVLLTQLGPRTFTLATLMGVLLMLAFIWQVRARVGREKLLPERGPQALPEA